MRISVVLKNRVKVRKRDELGANLRKDLLRCFLFEKDAGYLCHIRVVFFYFFLVMQAELDFDFIVIISLKGM